ncbi:hypothetical protein [Methylomonas koyamae]|nr:hypothetical protein [Methylomonas koyamae]
MIYDFNLNGAYRYFDYIKLNKKGRIDTWAIFWYASSYINNGLSLHPSTSFVKNIGHDGLGVNCANTDDFDVEVTYSYDVLFQEKISENIDARKAFEDFFIGLKKPLIEKIYKKLRVIFKW